MNKYYRILRFLLKMEPIQHLEKYMLTNKKLTQCLTPLVQKKVQYKKEYFQEKRYNEKVYKREKEDSVFFPEQKDSLFWCFYILKEGREAFDELKDTNIITEKKLKIEYVEALRKNKKMIKQYKIASLVTIENSLVNEPCIDMSCFFALCVLENIPLLYVYRKTYYELIMNTTVSEDSSETPVTNVRAILYKKENPQRYGCQLNVSSEQIETIKNTHFEIYQLNKPLKVFSAYKSNDLLEICKKLDINTLNADGKKRTNKELYESIVQFL